MIKVIKDLIPRDSSYHVAVSMGVDSVAALLWMLWKGYKVTPLHYNHNLRAQNGAMQDKFIEMCGEFNLLGKTDIGINLHTEDECRQARLDFYSRVAKGETIVTAHHRDDWVEGYLLNCFRGHPNNDPVPLQSRFPDFTVVHPFLPSLKSDFREFLERNGWMKWVVEDESNREIRGSRRNWIRTSIIPEMARQRLSLEKYALRRIKKRAEEIRT